jgi:hypothetical protein
MNGSSCNAGFLALVGANAIAGTTIAAGAGMGYATINGMLQGGPCPVLSKIGWARWA